MHPEKLWKWLDAVDEDHLDPLDQWGVPPPRRPSLDTPSRSYTISGGNYVETYHQYNEKRNAEIANLLESIPPAGLLLRNGSIRSTGHTPKVLAHEMENESPSKSLIPSYTTNCEGSGQGSDPPSIRKLQMSGREGNNDSANPKKLPTSLERAHVRNRSGALQSTPTVHAEVKDPVAIDCQGAKVVGGYQQNGLQSLPSMIDKLRRYTVAGEGARRALRRSNAQRRPSNVRVVPKACP